MDIAHSVENPRFCVACKHFVHRASGSFQNLCTKYGREGIPVPTAISRPDPDLCNDGRGWEPLE